MCQAIPVSGDLVGVSQILEFFFFITELVKKKSKNVCLCKNNKCIFKQNSLKCELLNKSYLELYINKEMVLKI